MVEEHGFDGHEPLWHAQAWLHGATLEALAGINEQALALLCEEAARSAVGAGSTHAGCGLADPGTARSLLTQLRPLWSALDGAARRRVAECPCLIVDAGFSDPLRWRDDGGWHVQDREGRAAAFFSVPGTVGVLRQVLAFAWHLMHSQPAAARLLLGVTPRCGGLIAALPLWRVLQLADTRPEWLWPRWCDRPQVWRQLQWTAARRIRRASSKRPYARAMQTPGLTFTTKLESG